MTYKKKIQEVIWNQNFCPLHLFCWQNYKKARHYNCYNVPKPMKMHKILWFITVIFSCSKGKMNWKKQGLWPNMDLCSEENHCQTEFMWYWTCTFGFPQPYYTLVPTICKTFSPLLSSSLEITILLFRLHFHFLYVKHFQNNWICKQLKLLKTGARRKT